MEKVKTICPRCEGNSYIRIEGKELDCPMCEEDYFGVKTHNGYVMLPIKQTRLNVEGGRESKIKWSGETLPEVGKVC